MRLDVEISSTYAGLSFAPMRFREHLSLAFHLLQCKKQDLKIFTVRNFDEEVSYVEASQRNVD